MFPRNNPKRLPVFDLDHCNYYITLLMKTNTHTKITAILAAALMPMIFAGCSAPSKVIVAPGYKKHFAIDAGLAIVILDEAPEIIYFGDVKKSLSLPILKDGDTSASSLRFMVWDYFREQLIKDITKEVDVKTAFITQVKHKYLVTKEFFKTKDEDIIVEIPDRNTRFTFDSAQASHVLFLDRIRIGTETDAYYADRAEQGLYTTTPRKLLYLISFVLWDNRELKHISYGRIKAWAPIVQEEAAPEDWESVSREFVRMVFEPTGFLKKE